MLTGVYRALLLTWGVESLHLLHQEWALQFCLPGWGLTWGGGLAWGATTFVLLVGGVSTLKVIDRRFRWLTGAALGGAIFPVGALLGGLLHLSSRPDWFVQRPWLKIKILWTNETHCAEYWESFHKTLGGQTNPSGVVPPWGFVGETLAQTRATGVADALTYLTAVTPVAPLVSGGGWGLPGWVAPVGLFFLSLGFSWWIVGRVQAEFNSELTETTQKVNQLQVQLDIGQTGVNASLRGQVNDLRQRITTVAAVDRQHYLEIKGLAQANRTQSLALETAVQRLRFVLTRSPWGDLLPGSPPRTELEEELGRLARLVLHKLGPP